MQGKKGDGRTRPRSAGRDLGPQASAGADWTGGRVELGSRSLSGSAVSVSAGPDCGSQEEGAVHRGHCRVQKVISGAETVETRPQMVLRCSSGAVPEIRASRAPLPQSHPLPQMTCRTLTLHSPPLLGLGLCKLQDCRVPARKSKRSMRERITYTLSLRNPKEKDLLALFKPAEDQSVFIRSSARSQRKEEAERLPWYKVL